MCHRVTPSLGKHHGVLNLRHGVTRGYQLARPVLSGTWLEQSLTKGEANEYEQHQNYKTTEQLLISEAVFLKPSQVSYHKTCLQSQRFRGRGRSRSLQPTWVTSDPAPKHQKHLKKSNQSPLLLTFTLFFQIKITVSNLVQFHISHTKTHLIWLLHRPSLGRGLCGQWYIPATAARRLSQDRLVDASLSHKASSKQA